MILSIVGFLIILCPLVIVHEMGHFLFAKLFNIKAEAFSVGFGPQLLKWHWGETEFRISAIPFGGYVKLLGEDRESKLTEEELKRSLHRQAAWKRFFVFFGGPLFNFLFAILVYMAMMVIGEPQVGNHIARVLPGSDAEKVGFKNGDQVVAVNGKPVRLFEELFNEIAEFPNISVSVEVLRKSESVKLTAIPTPEEGFSIYGETRALGEIKGLYASSRAAVVGVSNPASLAAKANLATGDQVLKWNDQPIESFEQLEEYVLNSKPGETARIQVKYKADNRTESVSITLPTFKASRFSLEGDLGIYSSELFIDKAIADAPASKGGIKSGDRLISIEGERVSSFFELKDRIQHFGAKKGSVHLDWESQGTLKSGDFIPTSNIQRDALLRKVTVFTIGIIPTLVLNEPAMVIERVLNPFKLLYLGTERMIVFSYRNFVSIGKIFTGDVSVATLGGPIMIGKIAGESISRGLIAFLTTMAIISVGLGVLNILPIPVLDGGHLLLLGLEVIRGKPLSGRQMEIIQQVGLSLILILMVIVIKNDITRLPFFQ